MAWLPLSAAVRPRARALSRRRVAGLAAVGGVAGFVVLLTLLIVLGPRPLDGRQVPVNAAGAALGNPAQVGLELKAGRDGVPAPGAGLEPVSGFYEVRRPADRSGGEVRLPLEGASRGEPVDLFTWTGNEWRWVAGSRAGEDGRALAELAELPANVAAMRVVGPRPAVVGALSPGTAAPREALDTLSGVVVRGLRPAADGKLIGAPATPPPGGRALVFLGVAAGPDPGEADVLNGLLGSDAARGRQIDDLVQMAGRGDYAGLEVDYRGIDPARREAFTGFIKDLADRLHQQGKALAVVLPVPAGGETGAYDWRAIGQAADVVRIPGEANQALFPKRTAETLDRMTRVVDRRKVELVVSPLSHDRGPKGIAELPAADALRLAAKIRLPDRPIKAGDTVPLAAAFGTPARNGVLAWDPESRTVAFDYFAEDGAHTVWLENAFSIGYKLQLAADFRLHGVMLAPVDPMWDEAGLWPLLRRFRETGMVSLVEPNGEELQPRWTVSAGKLDPKSAIEVQWTVPSRPAVYEVGLTLGDGLERVSRTERVGVGVAAPTQTPVTTTATATATARAATATPTPAKTSTARSTATAPAATPTPAPAAAPPPTTGAYPGVGYGFCVDLGSDLAGSLNLLKNAGFGWAKYQIRWEDVERERGQINWGLIDSAVNAANSRGIRVLLSVVTAPRWARPGDADLSVPGPPADPNTYAAFVRAIASRHKGKVQAFEIWNEQNLWYEWGGRGRRLSARQYVDLLKTAYGAIKAADPKAVVLSGALTPTGVNDGDIAYDDIQYLQMMYDAGLKRYSDAIAAHPSGFNNPPDDDPGRKTVNTTTFKGHWSFYFRRFEQVREVMVRNGDAGKQIWFTEFGWASSRNPYPEYAYAMDNSEQDQARYLVRAYEIAKAKGYVGLMAVWNLNYAPGADPNDRYAKRAFGVLNPDFTQRPAYQALAGMQK